ncbi:MAG: hypothetical protein K9N23_06040 [Akkermansiaceae bacterium]|nr:hypothetical protein [Akkermansiaceae bacterium]
MNRRFHLLPLFPGIILWLIAFNDPLRSQEPVVGVSWNRAAGHLQVEVTGISPAGHSHRLDFSPDLAQWVPIGASATLPWQYTDTEAPFRPRGFYRASSTPTESITRHSSWKGGITLPGDAFQSDPILTGFEQEEIRWIKFPILLDNLPRIYFQDTSQYAFHYNFANERLDPILGIGLEAYHDLTLHPPRQQLVLGAVLFAPNRSEFAIEFVGLDPYPAEMLRFLFDLVDASITRPADWTGFYFPIHEQAPAAASNKSFFNLGQRRLPSARPLGCQIRGGRLDGNRIRRRQR